MKSVKFRGLFATGMALTLGLTGCGSAEQSTTNAVPNELAVNQSGRSRQESSRDGQLEQKIQPDALHDHSGWWCDEHGVPEEQCGQCDSKLAATFQKKGDWCKEHDRPNSQCFVCHPELATRFAAQFEAKFGKKPPSRN